MNPQSKHKQDKGHYEQGQNTEYKQVQNTEYKQGLNTHYKLTKYSVQSGGDKTVRTGTKHSTGTKQYRQTKRSV